MAPRRHRRRRRPWYHTRAYRLTRTVALTAVLVTGCVHWTQDEEPPGPAAAGPGGSARAGARPGEAADGRDPLAPPRPQDGDSRPRSTPSPGTSRTLPGGAPGGPPQQSAAGQPGRPAQPPPAGPGSPPAAPWSTSAGPGSTPAGPGATPATPRSGPGPTAAVPPADPRARALRLLIPYLSVDAPVIDLRLDDRRRLPAPADGDAHRVGWYADGPGPGERGTAVAVGHLDTDNGPAVFAGLSELKRGKLIEVRRADGRTAVYAVDVLRRYEKAHFPNTEVYGDRGRPELRLITCGGVFHRRTGYDGNLVVFAHLTRVLDPKTRTP